MDFEISSKFVIENLHIPIIVVIITFLFVGNSAHKYSAWKYLILAWITNLLYIFTEGRELVGEEYFDLFSKSLLPILAVLNCTFFNYYVFSNSVFIKRNKKLSNIPLYFFILFVTYILTFEFIIQEDYIHQWFRINYNIFVQTPLILYSCLSIVFVGISIRNHFLNIPNKELKFLYIPYFAYGFLQLTYFFKVFDYQQLFNYAFFVSFIIKIIIAFGLIKLFLYQIKKDQTNLVKRARASMKKQIEAQYWQVLAFSWFAHELKNPIYSIRAISTSIINFLLSKQYSKVEQNCFTLNDSVNMITNVVESVKLAAEPFNEKKLQILNVNDAISDAVSILRKSYSIKSRFINFDFAQNLLICGVEENIKQIFIILIKNAYEADSKLENDENSNFRVTIKTRRVLQKSNYYVSIKVADFGPGISKEIKDQIFEPYFSTKSGINRGLGLYIAKRFINIFEGKVNVTSPIKAFKRGTLFEVILPLAKKSTKPLEFFKRIKDNNTYEFK